MKNSLEFFRETEFKMIDSMKIPKDWDLIPLEKGVEIHDNKRVPLSSIEREKMKGDYPYCGANGVVDFINDYKYDGEFVLLAEDGGNYDKHAKSCYIQTGKFWVNNHAHVIKGKEVVCSNKFLHHYLNFLNLNKFILGSTRTKLNQEQLRKIPLIRLPTEEENKIISVVEDIANNVSVLDQQNQRLIKLKSKSMDLLFSKGLNEEPLRNSEIGKIPNSWKVFKLSELFEVETGTTPPTKVESHWNQSEINWFTPADMSDEKVELDNSNRKVSKSAIENTTLNLITKNNLLISTRAPVGYVNLVTEDFTFNQGCKVILPLVDVSKLFYLYWLRKNRVLINSKSAGSTFKELSKASLEKLLIPFPELDEQNQIAKNLLDIDNLISIKKNKKVALERMSKFVTEKLLTGEIRIK